MGRFWALLFLLVPVLGVATFVVAPYRDIWFPIDVSQHGHTIDHLFMFILWLTGVVFIATEFALFWYAWKYNGARSPQPAKFSHGNHSLEIVWTILPAVTLLFIAIYQMDAWAAAKMRKPNIAPIAEVTGRQFNWDFRYAGDDGLLHTPDDVLLYDADFHLPVDEEILLVIKSADVLHSFFLPNLRLKQDVVPGMEQYMWFQAKRDAVVEGPFDIVCAELCGWGHYKMKGRVTFLSRPDFDAWLAKRYKEQEARTLAAQGE